MSRKEARGIGRIFENVLSELAEGRKEVAEQIRIQELQRIARVKKSEERLERMKQENEEFIRRRK